MKPKWRETEVRKKNSNPLPCKKSSPQICHPSTLIQSRTYSYMTSLPSCIITTLPWLVWTVSITWNKKLSLYVEEVNCMLTTSTWTTGRLEPEDWDCWSPNTNQRMLHKLMMHTPCYPLPHPVFKNLSLKAIGELGLLSIRGPHTPCMVPAINASPYFTSLHHNQVSADRLYCEWASGPSLVPL